MFQNSFTDISKTIFDLFPPGPFQRWGREGEKEEVEGRAGVW